MLQSIIVYLTLMFTMILFGFLAEKRVSLNPHFKISFFKWEVIFPLLGFAAVFGMRYGVGDDYMDYLATYTTEEGLERFEWGFRYFTICFQKLGIHYSLYFASLAFIQVFLFYYAFKDERYLFPYLSFFLFTGGYFLSWMNGIRQDLAACIFIFSIQYIEKNKFWKYLFCILIASLFHKSAIFLILFYPLIKSGRDYFKNIYFQLILLIIALIIYYSNIKVVGLISSQIEAFAFWLGYESYTMDQIQSMTIETNTGIGFLLSFLVDIIIISFSEKLKAFFSTNRFKILYNLYFIGILAGIIFAGSVVLLRPFRYFVYFKLIMLAYLVYYFIVHHKLSFNQILLFLVIIIYISLFGAMLYHGDINTLKFMFFWQL